jgi:glycosidase
VRENYPKTPLLIDPFNAMGFVFVLRAATFTRIVSSPASCIAAAVFFGVFFASHRAGAQNATESSGDVTIEAESPAAQTSRPLADPNGGTATYSWSTSTAIGGFSGSGLIQVLPNDGNTVTGNWTTTSPELQYTVNFTNPGTYYVWLRGYAETTETVSVYVGLDGASPAAAQIDLPKLGGWSWSNTAAGSAVPVAVTVGSAGAHTLNIWMRDAGFALDKILLTRNANFSAEYSTDFWRNQSIYQIVTDRFFDGDPSNNSAVPNYNPSNGGQAHGGDFKGIEQKLDYIKALGATAIWMSPVVKNANGDYHGYAATDFYQTNPRMGTLADLQHMVSEAHKRGLLVINDVVVNHGSTWVDSADAGWAAFKYPPTGYNLKYNSGGNTYATPFDNASLNAAFGNTGLANIFHNNGGTQNWGDSTQVELGELSSLDDFKTETTYVRQKMKEIWTYWISAAGFDAYRLDTVKHVEMGFWDEWSPAIRAAAAAADKPNFFQFGEVYDGSDAKVGSYTGAKTSGIFKMESAIDYPLYYQMSSVFATATGNTGQIENRYNNLTAANYDASALDSLILNLDNHDQPRFLSASGSSAARLEVALAFLYTSRGIPSLYYGTEQDFNGGADPWDREDMFAGQFEGGPSLGDNFNMTGSRFKLVAKLNNLRRLFPALRTGTHNNLWSNWSAPGLFAYARRLGTEEVYVILNTATSSQTIGARPTIHPAGTILVNVLNPSETVTVTSGTDGIPAITMPATSYKMFVAQAQVKPLSPVVGAITPAHDAASISPAALVTVTFSQAMNPAATQAAFSTTPATTGTFAWGSGNTTLTYTPSSNLAGGTLYTVRIDGTAADAGGLTLYAPFESRFTTGASSSLARPSVNSFSSSNITDASATLGASVTPNGAATTVSFEYGSSVFYGSTTANQSVGTGNSPLPAGANLSGLLPSTTYHFRVAATNSQGTTYGPAATFATSAILPQVTTTAASFVTTTTASLNGDVNPNGLPTAIWFEYGVQPNVLTITTASQDVGNGTANIYPWASIGGLYPDTTYFFRIVALTGSDVVRGALQSFTTLAVKPAISAVGATGINSTVATLNSTVNPNGSDSSAWFEYGTTTGYGTATAAQTIAAASANATVSSSLTGLVAGQTYHFRAAASNPNGATYGSDQSFTTGFPAPSVTTGAASPITTTNATVSGTVNPNGRASGYWVEYGTTASYGLSTRQSAADDAEAYSSFSYTSPNNTGGSGFGSFMSYTTTSSSRGGVRLVTSSSTGGTANRMIDGAKSFSAYAGTSTSRGSHSGYRALSNPNQQHGTFTFSVRFDLDNTKGFSGLNIKSQTGTSFGTGELVSVGMMPPSGSLGGNNTLVVTDAAGQRNIDLGAEARGALIDVKIDFDTRTGACTLGAKFRADAAYKTVAGALKLSGDTVKLAAFGYLNSNCTGSSAQNLIFDGLQFTNSASAGNGAVPVSGTQALAGLTPNTLYHYHVAAGSDTGTAYGTDSTFFTGPDLALSKTHSGSFTQNGTGQFSITVTNAGGVATSGNVTVTEQPPAGMTISGMSGTGWTYNSANKTCSRSDALAAGAAYPPITASVVLDATAAANLTNSAAVAGGSDANPSNNSAADPFTVAAVSALSPIEAWRQQHFGSPQNSGSGADLFDASGDGLPNLVKYALGLDPTQPNLTGRPALSAANGILSLTFTRCRDAADITYAVEGTSDLDGAWSGIYSSATSPYEGGSNATHAVTVSDTIPLESTPAGRRFLRLKITCP